MKKIYLMRHGETLFNTMDVNQGQCDSPLTENGIRQAKAAKAWFDAHTTSILMRSTAPRQSGPATQRRSSQAGCPTPAAKISRKFSSV